MAKKFIVTGDQYYGIDGQMLEIKRQLRLKGGSSLDPELVASALQDIVEGRFHNLRIGRGIMRIISGVEGLMIEAIDGKALISAANNIFNSHIDPDFKDLEPEQSGLATAEVLVEVGEIITSTNLFEIFTGSDADLDRLVLTQAQIIRFCEKYPDWLRKEMYATFFLTKAHGEYSVVDVRAYPNGLACILIRLGRGFERGLVWSAKYHHRMVLPQLAI